MNSVLNIIKAFFSKAQDLFEMNLKVWQFVIVLAVFAAVEYFPTETAQVIEAIETVDIETFEAIEDSTAIVSDTIQ